MTARFRVLAKLDQAARFTYGTVSIDRETGVVEIRPLRRRKVYTTTLAALAQLAVERAVLAELREKRKAREEARRARRGR